MNRTHLLARVSTAALFVLGALAVPATASAQCTAASPDNPCAPGDGSGAKSECRVEMIFNPMPKRLRGGEPIPDTRRGIQRGRIICYEGDPRCDFDPDLNNGSCTFRVEMCINNEDPRLDKCDPTLGLASFELLRPRADARKVDQADIDNLTAIQSLFTGPDSFGVPIVRKRTVITPGVTNTDLNQCKGPIELTVPQRQNGSGDFVTGTKRIRMVTLDAGERPRKDVDSLLLLCRPSTCGNGTLEEFWETCDDGNRTNGDGCNQACQIETGPSPTPTHTRTPTISPTITNTPTPTDTPTVSPTATDSPTPTITATPSITATVTATATASNTPTITATPTVTATATVTATPTESATPTETVVAGDVVLDVTLRPPGGSTGNCRGTCSGGFFPGASCGTNANCFGGTCVGPKTCVGGPFDGASCTNATQCTECRGSFSGTDPEGSCAIIQGAVVKVAIAPNGVCSPRTAPDVYCTTNAECLPGTTCELAGFQLTVAPEADVDGIRPVTIDPNSFILPPAPVPALGITACITAAGEGVGFIDCDGGASGINAAIAQDHNTTPGSATNSGSAVSGFADDAACNMPTSTPEGDLDYPCLEGSTTCTGGDNDQLPCAGDVDCPGGGVCELCGTLNSSGQAVHPGVCNSGVRTTIDGTFAAGDTLVVMPLAITQLQNSEWGADNLPCTADDTPAEPPAAVPVTLSTGTNVLHIYDANNQLGRIVGDGSTCTGVPCVARVDGAPLPSCAAIDSTGNLAGAAFGGGFAALDINIAGDIATTFNFVVESSEPAP